MRTIYDGVDRKYVIQVWIRHVHLLMVFRWSNIVRKALIRPFMLFLREPIIQLLGCHMAFVYGTLYRMYLAPNSILPSITEIFHESPSVFLTTIPSIFEGIYHQSVGIAGLHYIALGLGLSVTAQINARFIDGAYKHLCKRNGGVGKPEFRLRTYLSYFLVDV